VDLVGHCEICKGFFLVEKCGQGEGEVQSLGVLLEEKELEGIKLSY